MFSEGAVILTPAIINIEAVIPAEAGIHYDISHAYLSEYQGGAKGGVGVSNGAALLYSKRLMTWFITSKKIS